MSKKTFYSVRETAEHLGVHEKTIRRWIASGLMPAHRLGRQWRIARADLERFLRDHYHGVLPDVL